MNRKSPLISLQALAVALVGVAVLAIARPAQALLVENLTTNTVIFSDNFESETPGSNPVATVGIWDLTTGQNTIVVSDGISFPVTGDYSGNGSVGDEDYTAWKTQFGQSMTPGNGADGNANGTVDAADYTVWRDNAGSSGAGGISAYEGNQFLHLSRPMVGADFPDVRPSAYVLPFQTTTGDKFRISFAAYVPSEPPNKPIHFQYGGGDRIHYIELFTDGTINMDPGADVDPASVAAIQTAFQTDTWQEWTIEQEIGSLESDWTLDGTTVHFTQALNNNPSFTSVLFDISSGASFYLDSIPMLGAGQVLAQVPEPGTFFLFTIAAAAIVPLLRRRAGNVGQEAR